MSGIAKPLFRIKLSEEQENYAKHNLVRALLFVSLIIKLRSNKNSPHGE